MATGKARPGPRTVLAAIAAFALLAGCGGAGSRESRPMAADQGTVGLYTSLPIFWRETENPGELLDEDAPPHWALALLRERASVRPLDALASPDGKLPLARGGILVMAQPYPLSPQENVALDDWVRDGGRVLLFADPMLTRESRYALGDRRRPQDIVLLSPILTRWGLELQFEQDQPLGERQVELAGGFIPVNLPGRLAILPGTQGCALEAGGLLADCAIGRGRVLAMADAALLEEGAEAEEVSRRKAFEALLDRLAD